MPSAVENTLTYGVPHTVSPVEALAAEIARTNGSVEWLRLQIGALKPDQLIRGTKSVRRIEDADGSVKTETVAGSSRHELLQLYLEERRHLHALLRDALNSKQPDPPPGGWPRAS